MDGTGELFADFVKALQEAFKTETVRYPVEECLSYADLAHFLRSGTATPEQYVLVAESFSTPLAIQYAATNPPNLAGLVLCAGFATSPVVGWRRSIGSLLAPIFFRVGLPEFAARRFLVGRDAPDSLTVAVRAAVATVPAKVLWCRLRAVLACDVRADLSRVAVPILYLWGKHDRLVGVSSLEEIRRIKPQVTVEAIDGPHLLIQRESRQTAEAVARFVEHSLLSSP